MPALTGRKQVLADCIFRQPLGPILVNKYLDMQQVALANDDSAEHVDRDANGKRPALNLPKLRMHELQSLPAGPRWCCAPRDGR